MQMEFVRTVLGHYTDENSLLWQYLNETQPKLILNLSQKRDMHPFQTTSESINGRAELFNNTYVHPVFSVLVT